VIEGKQYRLDYKNDLSDSAWTAFDSEVATNSVITLRDPSAGAAATRFYRMVLP